MAGSLLPEGKRASRFTRISNLSIGRVGRGQSNLTRLPQSNLRASEPSSHVHLAVHPRRHPQVFVGLRLPTCPLKELTELEVAVGGERSGAEHVRQGESLSVVALGLLDING